MKTKQIEQQNKKQKEFVTKTNERKNYRKLKAPNNRRTE